MTVGCRFFNEDGSGRVCLALKAMQDGHAPAPGGKAPRNLADTASEGATASGMHTGILPCDQEHTRPGSVGLASTDPRLELARYGHARCATHVRTHRHQARGATRHAIALCGAMAAGLFTARLRTTSRTRS